MVRGRWRWRKTGLLGPSRLSKYSSLPVASFCCRPKHFPPGSGPWLSALKLAGKHLPLVHLPLVGLDSWGSGVLKSNFGRLECVRNKLLLFINFLNTKKKKKSIVFATFHDPTIFGFGAKGQPGCGKCSPPPVSHDPFGPIESLRPDPTKAARLRASVLHPLGSCNLTVSHNQTARVS